jgi:hypothetical protein
MVEVTTPGPVGISTGVVVEKAWVVGEQFPSWGATASTGVPRLKNARRTARATSWARGITRTTSSPGAG